MELDDSAISEGLDLESEEAATSSLAMAAGVVADAMVCQVVADAMVCWVVDGTMVRRVVPVYHGMPSGSKNRGMASGS